MARRYWSCRKCGTRNERTASRRCAGCGEDTKPKTRVPKHAEVLRDLSDSDWDRLSVKIHGGELAACAVCGKPRGERQHDRDHDHRTGWARGRACWYCNRELLRNGTLEQARAVVAYLERVEAWYLGQVKDAA